ncbi:uncharacterized protein CAALFM_CR01510CA [Candida albicans SC5314]|uniref:Uncharacterized protein n=1 Tax=Candida albicans (strain SC5314 / ATCC MYA-2876) TaxID=237561 RepID=A0A1D8PS07_CANAL|nr:uncharacterized protein CAALFM_CR01510CA [Candida albicans SC5314]AOW30910.1 hypothetical protein CAALFM_CR01510CA [Candida albicans SC5314]|eukprot:XP_718205.2 hypothetical protein CAALFM_CR01510CA [Candida albicans SC5314]
MNEEATINFLSFFFFLLYFLSLSLSVCVCCVCRKFFSLLLLLLWFSLISVLVHGWCYYDFRSSSPGFFLFRSRLALNPLLTPTLRYYHHHHHHHQYNLLAPYIIIVNINHFFF